MLIVDFAALEFSSNCLKRYGIPPLGLFQDVANSQPFLVAEFALPSIALQRCQALTQVTMAVVHCHRRGVAHRVACLRRDVCAFQGSA